MFISLMQATIKFPRLATMAVFWECLKMKKFVVIFIAVFLLLFFSFKEHPSATDFTIFEIVLLTHVVSLIFSVPIWCLVWLLSKVLSKPFKNIIAMEARQVNQAKVMEMPSLQY